jgi:hypothetical protein
MCHTTTMNSETFQSEQENSNPAGPSSSSPPCSPSRISRRRERRAERQRGRSRTPPPPREGRSSTPNAASNTTADVLLTLEMYQLPSEELFPQAVGDDLVGATTTTTFFVNRSLHSHTTLNSSLGSCLTFSSETPLTPPDNVRNRSRNIEGIPPTCLSLDQDLEEDGHTSSISLPGAYVMCGRPIGCTTQPPQRNQNHNGRPPMLSLDDRMSSRSFEWWLRTQADEEEPAILGDDEELVLDASAVRRNSPNCGEELDLDFNSIPPELRPVKSSPEMVTHKEIPRQRRRGLSPKKIIHKIIIAIGEQAS